jgi:hypothetical protein
MKYNKNWETCAAALRLNSTLDEALQDCQGLFPYESVKIFRGIYPKKTDKLIEEAWYSRDRHISAEGYDSFVLSTWRFKRESVREIMNLLPDTGGRTLLLGAPTMLQGDQGRFDNLSSLLIDVVEPEKNPQNISVLNYDIGNLCGNEFSHQFDRCFLDPPWYLGPLKSWLAVASQSVKNGGIVAFPLLQELTRPGGAKDRDNILMFASHLGLEPVVHTDVILYEPPSFERAILRRIGLPPICWKRADLVVCRRGLDKGLPCSPSSMAMPPFKRVSVGRVVFDVVFDRYDRNAKDIVCWQDQDYWMLTPSRRDRYNVECNVFTSNGARFVSPKPLELYRRLSEDAAVDLYKLSDILPGDLLAQCGEQSA